jgi:hypothetical protein
LEPTASAARSFFASGTLPAFAKLFESLASQHDWIVLPFRVKREEYLGKLLPHRQIIRNSNRSSLSGGQTKQIIEHVVDHLPGFRPVEVTEVNFWHPSRASKPEVRRASFVDRPKEPEAGYLRLLSAQADAAISARRIKHMLARD